MTTDQCSACSLYQNLLYQKDHPRLGVHREWNAYSFFWAREGGNGNERATRKKEALADEEGQETRKATPLTRDREVSWRIATADAILALAPESGSAPRSSSRFFLIKPTTGSRSSRRAGPGIFFFGTTGRTDGRREGSKDWSGVQLGRRGLFFFALRRRRQWAPIIREMKERSVPTSEHWKRAAVAAAARRNN